MTTIYQAMTPFGAFQAAWGEDEESRVEYSGSAEAIAFFKAFLDLNSLSGFGGALIQFDTLEPGDFYGFCQSEKHGISVIPTEDDLKDELDNDEMNVTPLMDAVSPAEVSELIGEGAQILNRLDESADTFFPDLDRLRYIVTELGDDAPPADERNADARAYMQSVIVGSANLSDLAVADELGKIHEAHAADPDMLALFKSAVKAYADYAIARANEALAKG